MKEKLIRYADKLHLPPGKTIVITGGNSGIGFSVAKHLIRYGYRVILAVRNRSRGEKAKEELLL
ncbi:MAG: SDR family NAD(P)-dependent oxidoreductase, partial [Bacilli bacterium]|nr:SDR family NAD(P)-dependent oxidoreductase [Bacilli bacterium]